MKKEDREPSQPPCTYILPLGAVLSLLTIVIAKKVCTSFRNPVALNGEGFLADLFQTPAPSSITETELNDKDGEDDREGSEGEGWDELLTDDEDDMESIECLVHFVLPM